MTNKNNSKKKILSIGIYVGEETLERVRLIKQKQFGSWKPKWKCDDKCHVSHSGKDFHVEFSSLNDNGNFEANEWHYFKSFQEAHDYFHEFQALVSQFKEDEEPHMCDDCFSELMEEKMAGAA